LQKGALEVYPVCEWGAIERVQSLGGGKIIGLDTTVRTGALMVRKDSKIQSLGELRNVPIAVTWHAGTFYAAIEALEAAGVPFAEIKLVHANDRLDALISGATEAAALMEPLVSRAWRGGIVAGDDVDEATATKLRRALNRAIEWLRENENRSRQEVLRDLEPRRRLDARTGRGEDLSSRRIQRESRVDEGARVSDRSAELRRGRPQQVARSGLVGKINAPGWEWPRALVRRGKLKMVKALPPRAGAFSP